MKKDIYKRELSAKEMAIDIACDFHEESLVVYISKTKVTITHKLDNGYINVSNPFKQLQFRTQLKLRSFIAYLQEYKKVSLLNESAIDYYQWV
ncbi:hypothetical protein [Alkalihalobacillus sp. BA299]|uniref:hypothetical protein n=1 Tax=Alkalihalobacillus sp. BA299 TaxID=2815938 RepID=UPI001ADB41F3|nr:hypothetical protein [Alkalihalobacillus sp. BA299]